MKEKVVKTRTQIYLPPEQHIALKRIYAETGQRITESVKLALDRYLSDEDVLKMQGIKND